MGKVKSKDEKKKKRYFTVSEKFLFSMLIVIGWEIFSIFIANLWMINMCDVLPVWLAFTIAVTVAVLPGFMITLTWCGVSFDKPREYKKLDKMPDISLLVPVHNGEAIIYETLSYIAKQEYNGKVYCIVIDNNSTDNTKGEIERAIKELKNEHIIIQYRFEPQKGKFHALNNVLPSINTKYVVTIDDDTLLWKESLTRLVTHIVRESENKKVGAVAGACFVRNSRKNLLTKMEEWDYFMSMSGLKRSQSLFSATLVAQGAFSIYDTELVKKLGGWSDAIVEDMVLSFDILHEDYIIQYEPTAVSFTIVPTKMKDFLKQRIRWSRGPIECLRKHMPWDHNGYSKFFIMLDYIMILVDFGLILFWVPGLIAALFFHNYLIVGVYTLWMIPITIFLYWCHFRKQKKYVFDVIGLKVRKNTLGLILFTLFYHIILAFCGCVGNIEELLNYKRVWK